MNDKNQNTGAGLPNDVASQPFSDIPMASEPLNLDPAGLSIQPAGADSGVVAVPVSRAGFFHRKGKSILKWTGLTAVIVAPILTALFLATNARQETARLSDTSPAASFDTQIIPLDTLAIGDVDERLFGNSVTVNGQLRIDGSILLAPSVQPSSPQLGELYYDRTASTPMYFNGAEFVAIGAGVESVGGLTGQISLGGGLRAVGNQLINTGVLSLGGQSGAIVLGSGLSLASNTLQNTGVLNVIAGTGIAASDDGNGSVTISNTGSTGSGTGTVASSGGTVGRIPVFTGSQNIEDSLINQSGLTVTVSGDLSVVTGGLSLTNALTVANGGTGAASLAANGVLIGNGTGAITSVTAGVPSLCLLSTAGAPTWGACPGGSGVSSLNGLAGALSVANASGAGATITIDDASTSTKGIAQFNATNFSDDGGGVINTAQDIDAAATPTFAGINTNNITPSAALTVGAVAQQLILQGDGGTLITATSGANTTTVGFNAPSADVTINFPALSVGTYDVCTTSGNCLGGGGGGANTALSNLAGVAINTTLLPGSAGSVNLGSATLSFGDIFLAGTSGTPGTNNFRITGASTGGTQTITLPDDSGTVCLDTGNCAGSGGGVTTAGGTVGTLPVFTGAQALGDSLVSQSGGTVTAAGHLNLTSGNQFRINGSQISSANLSNDANLAKLGQSQTFIGSTNAFQNAVNSTNAFNVQNAAGALLLAADTSNGEIELGTSSALDGRLVFRNVSNANTVTVVPGAPTDNRTVTLPDSSGIICLDTGNCAGAGATLQTAYNFSAGGTTPKIKLNSTLLGVDIQDADTTIGANLFNVRESNGAGLGQVMFGVSSTGQLTLQNGANSTTALRLLTDGGTSVLTGDTQNGRVTLGQGGTLAGQLLFSNATNGNLATLQAAVLGQDTTYTLPDPGGASASICLSSGNCAGVGGTGDVLQGGNSFGTALILGTNDNNSFSFETNNIVQATIAAGGATTFRNSVDSANAFQVQNAASDSIFSVNTSASVVTISGDTVGTQDFELVTFPPASPGTWTTGGNANWVRSTTEFSEGSASAASGTLSDSQTSWLDLDYTFAVDGMLRFYWKVDSEDCGTDFCDGMYLLVDDDAGDHYSSYKLISGDVGWAEVDVPVTAGAHSFRWVYEKDGGASTGADKAWIDDVRIIEGGLTVNGALSVLGISVTDTLGVGGNLKVENQIHAANIVATDSVFAFTVTAVDDIISEDDVIVNDFLYVTNGAEFYGDVDLYNGDSTSAFVVYNSSDVPQFTVDSTNSYVYIGNISGDTTGALLILDTKTNSGDPAGVNGAMYYNSNAGKFRCYEAGAWIDCIGSSPVGAINMYGGSSAPTGWLMADGSAVSRTTYAALFAVIGTTYGSGNGSTTFNLPDLRSRSAVGAGTSTKVMTFSSRSSNTITVTGVNNTSDNELQTGTQVAYASTGTTITGLTNPSTYYLIRISNTSFQLATSRANAVAGTAVTLSGDGSGTRTFTITVGSKTLGNTGGEETHSLTSSEIPSHAHDLSTGSTSSNGDHSHSSYGSNNANGASAAGAGGPVFGVRVDGAGNAGSVANFTSTNGAHTHTLTGNSGATGSSGSHNNLQPFVVVNYIIRY